MNTKRPICGILSVTLPLVGLLVADVGFALARLSVAIFILSALCSIAGIGIGIAGLVRRERFHWLPILGLMLSTGTAVIYFAA